MVADREGRLVGRAPERELARHRTALRRDLACEVAVALGIEAVEAGADHSYRQPLRGQGASVGIAVDAESKAGNDAPAGGGEIGGEAIGDGAAVVRRAARADNRHHRLRERGDIPFHIEGERRAGRSPEPRGIAVVRRGHNPHPVPPRLLLLLGGIDLSAGAGDLVRVRFPRGGNAPAGGGRQALELRRTDAVRQIEGYVRLTV